MGEGRGEVCTRSKCLLVVSVDILTKGRHWAGQQPLALPGGSVGVEGGGEGLSDSPCRA